MSLKVYLILSFIGFGWATLLYATMPSDAVFSAISKTNILMTLFCVLLLNLFYFCNKD